MKERVCVCMAFVWSIYIEIEINGKLFICSFCLAFLFCFAIFFGRYVPMTALNFWKAASNTNKVRR